MNSHFDISNFCQTKFICVLFMLCNIFSFSQVNLANDILTNPIKGIRVRAEVVNGDTVPLVYLNDVEVVTEYVFKNQRQREQWTRVKYNVKIVYPYAILAAAKLKEYDVALAKISDEKQKKKFIKVCEKDLRHEFEDELKALTVSQGKILMKLIDRETGKTTYDVVKFMRGTFQAAMWQTVAVIFGHNMKVEYDANVEDIMIERAIKLVEEGRF
jgi:Domain of unknown function (DUF4294)